MEEYIPLALSGDREAFLRVYKKGRQCRSDFDPWFFRIVIHGNHLPGPGRPRPRLLTPLPPPPEAPVLRGRDFPLFCKFPLAFTRRLWYHVTQ